MSLYLILTKVTAIEVYKPGNLQLSHPQLRIPGGGLDKETGTGGVAMVRAIV